MTARAARGGLPAAWIAFGRDVQEQVALAEKAAPLPVVTLTKVKSAQSFEQACGARQGTAVERCGPKPDRTTVLEACPLV